MIKFSRIRLKMRIRNGREGLVRGVNGERGGKRERGREKERSEVGSQKEESERKRRGDKFNNNSTKQFAYLTLVFPFSFPYH